MAAVKHPAPACAPVQYDTPNCPNTGHSVPPPREPSHGAPVRVAVCAPAPGRRLVPQAVHDRRGAPGRHVRRALAADRHLLRRPAHPGQLPAPCRPHRPLVAQRRGPGRADQLRGARRVGQRQRDVLLVSVPQPRHLLPAGRPAGAGATRAAGLRHLDVGGRRPASRGASC